MPFPSPPLRTLVIDDDEMSRELLTLLLEGEGYQVGSAVSGEAALAHLSKSSNVYDVILVDLHMPGIAGAELAEKLRHACGPSTLLLAISGSQPSASTVEKFDGFLLKPFAMEEIATAVRRKADQTRVAIETVPLSHQSRTLPVTSEGLSIAASAAQDASNTGMAIQAQQHESFSTPSILNATTENIPVLDEHIYRQLADSMTASQLREMYTLCINDARKRIAGMHSLVAAHDGSQFVREAHAIKGGSGMLGATELHRLAAELETCGLSSKPNGSAQDVNSLDELCAACDRLERMLGTRV